MNLAGCFLKFGEQQHMLDFHEKGVLFCNPINYFTAIEDHNLRGDEMENVVELIYMVKGEVLLGKPDELPIKNGLRMAFRDGRFTSKIIEPFGNLFCLYAINLLDKQLGEMFTIDAKVKGFGDWFVFIHDTQTFLKRVKEKLDQLRIPFDGDIVQYLDLKTYSGKKTIFQKDVAYDYQQEYRLFLTNRKPDPLVFEIGSIEDISVLCPSDNIEDLKVFGIKKDEETFMVYANLEKGLS